MTVLQIRDASQVRYDLVSLGEVMLRLDPGEGRISTSRTFRVWEGGGEYNVARGLRRCSGLRTGVVTALVGRLVEDLMFQGGVGLAYLQWVADDGIGRGARNGLNFTERGFGVRGAKGVSDRGHTAISQLHPDDVDWDQLFREDGVRWLHTGGSFAGLSDTTPAVLEAAFSAAKRHGTVISYDLNYRPSLWKAVGGRERAREVNRHLAPFVDVMIGNEEDFTACLGIEVAGTNPCLTELPADSFRRMIGEVADAFPALRVIATTLRGVQTATVNDWGAIGWSDGHFRRGDPSSGSRDPGPGRWRGQLRVGIDLRAAVRVRPPGGTRIRSRTRCPRHDHPRRHVDGEPGGGSVAGARRERTGAAVRIRGGGRG